MNQIENLTDRNQCLNFLKGIGCMGVVFIHVKFPGLVGEVVSKISQFAVPVFFMIAGYYAFGCNEMVIKRRLLKILKIFIYGYLTYGLYAVLTELAHGGSIENWIRVNYNVKTVIKYVVFCTIDFAVPLWYLIAMLETYIFWYFIVNHGKEEIIVRFIPLLFLVRIVLTMICETNDFTWFWKINFVSCALPWFMLGYYWHGNGSDMIGNISRGYLLIISLFGGIMALMPIVFNIPVNFSCVGIVFYAAALFALALKYPDKPISRHIAFIGDRLSLNVYIFHVIVSKVITLGGQNIFKVNVISGWFLWIIPLLTVIISILFSYILYRIKIYKWKI